MNIFENKEVFEEFRHLNMTGDYIGLFQNSNIFIPPENFDVCIGNIDNQIEELQKVKLITNSWKKLFSINSKDFIGVLSGCLQHVWEAEESAGTDGDIALAVSIAEDLRFLVKSIHEYRQGYSLDIDRICDIATFCLPFEEGKKRRDMLRTLYKERFNNVYSLSVFICLSDLKQIPKAIEKTIYSTVDLFIERGYTTVFVDNDDIEKYLIGKRNTYMFNHLKIMRTTPVNVRCGLVVNNKSIPSCAEFVYNIDIEKKRIVRIEI